MHDIPSSLRHSRAAARSAPGLPLVGLGLLAAALAAPPLAEAVPAARPVQEAREAAGGEQGDAEAEPGRADSAPDRFTVTRAAGEVDVDARLDEPVWSSATAISLPYEWRPGDNTPAPVETTCYVAYDEAKLYLACRALDPRPSEIRAHMADRDTPFDDDHVVFLLDTYDDQRRAYEFRINPYGVQMDAILTSNSEDFSWDAIWDSDGRVTAEGYVVEAAIPFESLSFQPTSGPQTWGIIVDRSWPRSVRHRLRSIRTDRDDTCLLCQADKLVGIRGVQPGSDVELNPTLTASRTDSRPSPGAPELESGSVKWEPGMNVRWRVTPNLALDATANPDFSQVEADVAQLEVNTRFALFFPEKRPFFLEGADVFEMPANLVFTRTVVDPIAGFKTTGKVGGNALGAFVAHDESPSLVIPGPQGSSALPLSGEVTTGVARYRRDLGTSSSVGALVTAREASGYHNRVLAADADVRLSNSTSLVGLVTGSRTDYPADLAAGARQPAEAFGGWGAMAGLLHRSRDWSATATWQHVDDRFRADAGFIPQVGFAGPELSAGYSIWGDAGRWFSRIAPRAEFYRYEDEETGELLEQEVELAAEYEGPLQTYVNLELNLNRQRFAGRTFDLARPVLFAAVRPVGDVGLSLRAERGDAIDFSNARPAERLRLDPGLELRLGAHVDLGLRHTLERLSREGERIFLAHLSQARLVYHFDRRAFVRAILQYEDLDRNPAAYGEPVEEEGRDLFTQLLFSYEVNPRTVLFAGYSGNRSGFTDAERRLDLREMDRSFFLKLAYAWRP